MKCMSYTGFYSKSITNCNIFNPKISHEFYLIVTKCHIKDIKTMQLMLWGNVTLLYWLIGHPREESYKLLHHVLLRSFDVTMFLVADPRWIQFFLQNNFTLHAKHLLFLIFCIKTSLYNILFICCDCKTFIDIYFHMLIVKPYVLCKDLVFYLAILCHLAILKLLGDWDIAIMINWSHPTKK